MIVLLRHIAFAILAVAAFARTAHAAEFVDVVASVKLSVVGIGNHDRLRRPPNLLNGTGFAVSNGNLVVTAYHVVQALEGESEQMSVFVGEGETAFVRSARLVSHDEDYDVALLEIDGDPLPVLSLHAGPRVPDGTEIGFTGFPIGGVFGLYPATHRGIIAASTPVARPQVRVGELTPDMIRKLQTRLVSYQLDATAYPGNSGGPVYLSATGEVIALVNSTFVKKTKEAAFTSPSGVTFAMPVSYIAAVLRRYESGSRNAP